MREERVLADRKLARTGGQLDELLTSCWEETTDPGPYDFRDKPIDWSVVLQGDRFFALLMIRALTYGPQYAFGISCRNCRTSIAWEVDLTKLPVRALSSESRAAFVAGNRFETTLPDAGRRVTFKLETIFRKRGESIAVSRIALGRRRQGPQPRSAGCGPRERA